VRTFHNRFLTLVPPLEEPRGVVLPPSPRVAQRSAGSAQLAAGETPPTSLPLVSDFSITGTAPNAAYFEVDNVGRTGPRVSDLVLGSAAQMLRDIREQLNIDTGERIYSLGLLERAAVRAEEFNQGFPAELRAVIPPLPTIPDTGSAPLPLAWMGILLWLTYFPDVRRSALVFPTRWKMPDMVADVFPDTRGPVVAFQGFNDRDLRVNPFTARGPTIDVTGDPGDGSGSSSSSSSSSGGLLLVGVGLVALLLLGGKK